MTDKTNNEAENQEIKDEKNISVPNDFVERMIKTLDGNAETNKAVLGVAESVLKMAVSEAKQRRLRLFLMILPIILILAYALVTTHLENNFDPEGGYVAEVRVDGVIKQGASASAAKLIPALNAAFKDEKAKGVVIKISSPGGSPTQSILIRDEIVKLQNKYDKPVTVIGEESITSGSLWIACAADTIYALPSTYVGSIGVIMESYDVSELAKDYNVSKHIITAGINKRRMDLFKAPDAAALVKFQSIADQLHTEFKNLVRDCRGDRLSKNEDLIFSGDFWLGREAKELGLVDVISTTSNIMQDIYGTDTVKNYNKAPGFMEQINPFGAAAETTIQNLSTPRLMLF
jgi:protease-4